MESIFPEKEDKAQKKHTEFDALLSQSTTDIIHNEEALSLHTYINVDV